MDEERIFGVADHVAPLGSAGFTFGGDPNEENMAWVGGGIPTRNDYNSQIGENAQMSMTRELRMFFGGNPSPWADRNEPQESDEEALFGSVKHKNLHGGVHRARY